MHVPITCANQCSYIFSGMKAELEETKVKSIETSEKLKERNRQYQKLQVCNSQNLSMNLSFIRVIPMV